MEKLLINGGKKLYGTVNVDASKNAFLPMLAATVLCDGQVFFENYCNLSDLLCCRKILSELGIESCVLGKGLLVDTRGAHEGRIVSELAHQVRASVLFLGALLGRFGKAVLAHPGGCKIGARPIDIHIKAFRQLGAKIVQRHGYIYCNGQNMKSGQVMLDFPSVGATENLMMCACVLDGETTIKNAAKEPEVVDLQNFLVKMGARIFGAGTDCITIRGTKVLLRGGNFCVMPDRIVAGTYLLAAAICGGDVTVVGARAENNESLLGFLRQSACKIGAQSDRIRIRADKRLLCADKIQTMPYPCFPTDLQPQMMVLQSISKGVCIIEENLFENRFGIVPELVKMGASISVNGRTALVKGTERLFGAEVFASDLRAGAALVLAGLKAEGYTTIFNIPYIDRGYEKIEEKFSQLGADIRRLDE